MISMWNTRNALCGQNVERLNVKPGGRLSNKFALKRSSVEYQAITIHRDIWKGCNYTSAWAKPPGSKLNQLKPNFEMKCPGNVSYEYRQYNYPIFRSDTQNMWLSLWLELDAILMPAILRLLKTYSNYTGCSAYDAIELNLLLCESFWVHKYDRQCTYNVTLRRICATIVAVEKRWVLHNLCVCVYL